MNHVYQEHRNSIKEDFLNLRGKIKCIIHKCAIICLKNVYSRQGYLDMLQLPCKPELDKQKKMDGWTDEVP